MRISDWSSDVCSSDLMKPYQIDDVAPHVAGMKGQDIRLVSILAGISTAALRSRFPGHADIVRVMPNTPVGVGQGVCALYADERTSDAAREQVEALMQPLAIGRASGGERGGQYG